MSIFCMIGSMLFVSIPDPVKMPETTTAMEWRLDLFPKIEIEAIGHSLQKAMAPVMLTVRRASQGGGFQGTELDRQALIWQLLSFEPPFFDLEYDMDPDFIQSAIAKHPKTQFIVSYHNFDQTPVDLEELYITLQKPNAFSYKIAAKALSTNDALRMLLLAKRHPDVSVICMGERGEFARVLAPVVGNRVNYASLNGSLKTGPGQLSVTELMDIYHYASLNEKTEIYGLIGDPVGKSPGHLHHNAVFRARKWNAVYVKMCVQQEELPEFMQLATELGVKGLSVTIPLKEKVVPFVDCIEPSSLGIGAINTLKWSQGKLLGINTDGLGALDAIEQKLPVRGKKVVLLGAGGAARAIAFEAKTRGARVVILNRTVERAQGLAAELGCEAGGLNEVPEDYDVIVNCSPDEMPIDPANIRAKTVAMDVVYAPRETEFLKAAMGKGCQIVYGEEMYLNQAARQTAFWNENVSNTRI